MSRAPTLLSLIMGGWVSRAIYVVAKLGIADLLKPGAKTCADLAKATGVDPRSLFRVMRALASVGIFAEGGEGRFELTPLAEGLQTDAPNSMRALAIMLGEESYHVWGELPQSVVSGEPAFERVYGMRRFEYLGAHPKAAEVFDQAMTSLNRRVHASVVSTYPFSEMTTIIDVGGGNGSLLSLILQANPKARGVLLETPVVIESAKRHVESLGFAERCEFVAGDFFRSVPEGGDVYILLHVIESFDDDRCSTILNNCRRVMAKHAKMLIVEPIISRRNEPSAAKLLDLHMLVVTGGRLRTEGEYQALLTRARLRLTIVTPTDSGESVIEAACC